MYIKICVFILTTLKDGPTFVLYQPLIHEIWIQSHLKKPADVRIQREFLFHRNISCFGNILISCEILEISLHENAVSKIILKSVKLFTSAAKQGGKGRIKEWTLEYYMYYAMKMFVYYVHVCVKECFCGFWEP